MLYVYDDQKSGQMYGVVQESALWCRFCPGYQLSGVGRFVQGHK